MQGTQVFGITDYKVPKFACNTYSVIRFSTGIMF